MSLFSINNKASQPNALRRFYRAVALSLCVCMLVTDLAQAAPMERRSLPAARDSKTRPNTTVLDSNDLVRIPPRLGTVEEAYASPRATSGGRPATVYYIQDAHDSLEAQENIAKIIKHLVQHSGVKTVFEEGYEGDVPTDKYFSGIKDPQVKQKVAHSLMSKLLIGGAEYAHITRFNSVARRLPLVASKKNIFLRATRDERRDFSLIGADNVQLHLENIEWYRQAVETRSETDADLQDLAARLQVLAVRELPKEIKAWIKLRKRFDSGELDLIEYLKRLVGLISTWSHPHEGENLQSDPLIFLSSYHNILTVLSAEHARTPETLKAVQNIPHRALFSEIDRIENEFAEQALQTPEQKTIFKYGKILSQLQRLNTLEISFEEYEAIQGILKTFKTEELLTFIAQQLHQSLALSKQWEMDIRRAMRFYELAEERDQAVERTLKKHELEVRRWKVEGKTNEALSKEKGSTSDERREAGSLSAILVFGGFHKENIKEILRRNGFSYVVIAPKISTVRENDHVLYRTLMSRGVPGFSLPAVARLATRYTPIFEIGEFLNQSRRVQELIKNEARKIAVRSEVRKPKRQSLPKLADKLTVLDGLKADRRFQVIETDGAVYVIYHRAGLSREKIPEDVYSAVDSIVLSKPTGQGGALPKWLEEEKERWFIPQHESETPKEIFDVHVLSEKQSLSKKWPYGFMQGLVRGLYRGGQLFFGTVSLPGLFGVLIYGLGLNSLGVGVFIVALGVLVLGPVYAPPQYKKRLMVLSGGYFFTQLFGLKNAIAGHKMELFIAPRLRRKLGRKPVILVDTGGISSGALGAYLNSARLRRRTMTFHRWVGYLFSSQRPAANTVAMLSGKRLGKKDIEIASSLKNQPVYYHVQSFTPTKAMGVKPLKNKKVRKVINGVKELLPLVHWFPKPRRAVSRLALDAVLTDVKPIPNNLKYLESRISKARLNSRDSILVWLSLIDEWRYQVSGSPPELNFDSKFNIKVEQILSRFLLGQVSQKETLAQMLEISQQALGIKRAVLILRKPFEYLLEQYVASVQQRLFLPLEKALQAEPREPVKQGMGRFLQSDPARLPLSTPFWMLIGSFIHGATLGAVFGFLVHYVFRPLYDRMQVSTRGSLWSPLRPQALLELGEHSNWHDIRLA